MNRLTEEINEQVFPRAALIAYAKEHSDSYFLELRTIDGTGRMGAGMPVTYEFMNSLSSDYSEEYNAVPHGRIPSNLLYCDIRRGHDKYVWYNPPRRRMMYFSRSLNIENAEYNLPGVVYSVKNDKMTIYAYKGDTAPRERTELFAAPFFNIYDTRVCLGSARSDKPSNPKYADMLEYWEKMFWGSEFTHLGDGGNPTRSNLTLVTKAAKDSAFDCGELKPLKITFKDLLK